MTGYEPLNTLKPVDENIWIVDGPVIRFYGMPFSTRMTVIRLASGDLFLHSPTTLSDGLKDQVAALGEVRHLVSPNWIHYAYIADWAAVFPGAIAWASPGVVARAAKRLPGLRFDRELGPVAEADWAGEIEQMIVEGNKLHREVVFFHRASGTLILTDLIENFEPAKLPFWFRPLVRMAGIADPDGQMPRDMRLTFRKGRDALCAAVETMIGWGPERVIVAHGRWYASGGVAELRRAFRWVLDE